MASNQSSDVEGEFKPKENPPNESPLLAQAGFSSVVGLIRDYAIIVLDVEGRIRSWNQGAERLKGYRASEIIGEHFSRFYTPEDAAQYKPAAALRIARQDGRYEAKGWRVRKDGSRFWADVILTRVDGPGGELIGFVKVVRDLTERKLAEENLQRSEARYRSIIDGVKDHAIFLLDPQGNISSWSTAAANIMGYRADEIIGRPISLLYCPEDVDAGKPHVQLEIASKEGRVEDEGWRVRKDGSRFWAETVTSRLQDDRGELIGFVRVTRDLTERIKANEDRMMRQAAEAAVSERDAFLSMASHEMRSPLWALKLYVQAISDELKSGHVDSVVEKLPARLERVQRQVDRINSLINRLMNVSLIASGQLHLNLEEVDISQLASAVIADLAEEARQAECQITLHTPGPIIGRWDRERLEDVILNLLQNALKFGAGKPIEVGLRVEGARAWISVQDHGIGVAEDDHGRIFERFERAVESRNYGGFGLGLWISRHIAQALGGEIQLESRPGEGATFTMTLPLASPNAAARL
jgi:PAS domain S-box-containing protein